MMHDGYCNGKCDKEWKTLLTLTDIQMRADIPSIPDSIDIAAAHFSIMSNGNDAFFVLSVPVHNGPFHTTPPPSNNHSKPNPTSINLPQCNCNFPFSYDILSSFSRGVFVFFSRFFVSNTDIAVLKRERTIRTHGNHQSWDPLVKLKRQ